MAGRSHNVAAQATTLGKRFASAADELLVAYQRVDDLIGRYPLRGIKGPVGTSQDMLDLLGGDANKVAELEIEISRYLGFEQVLDSVGQVYPRSLDYDVVSALVQLSAAPSSLAKTIRLMAGNELVTEGFKAGQVGSSAMPHKMNTRSCERVNGFAVILRGYASMVGELAGDQWNEGDVSCSVVRRVALADAFFAIDGLFETFLTVLDEFGVFPAVVQRELERYLPFLATTKVLMAAVRSGVGRETAHEVIKEHAVAVALEMREKGAERNDLLARLASDERLGLTASDLEQLVAEPLTFTGTATDQVAAVVLRVAAVVAESPRGCRLPSWGHPVTASPMANVPAAPELPGVTAVYSGKVRDLYEYPDGSLLFVASDRMSAYDWVLPTTIPDKGRILTAMTLWWFEQLADVVPNHLLSTDVPAEVAGRAMVTQRLDMFPVECVARGYLAGSGLSDYTRDRPGLRQRVAAGPRRRFAAARGRSSPRQRRQTSVTMTRTSTSRRSSRPLESTMLKRCAR